MNVLATSIATLACLGQGDPGSVVVVGGDLEPIEFSIEAGIDYQLSYNTSRLALWFDEEQTQPAPPNTVFQSPPPQIDHGDLNGDTVVNGADVQLFVAVFLGIETDPDLIDQADYDESGSVNMADVPPFVVALLVGIPHGDVNRDGRVDGTDIQPFVNVLLGEYDPEADLDSNGVVDLADVPLFVDVLLFGPPSSSTTITLFSEGLAPSGGLCDTPIDLLTDTEGDGTFAWAATEEVTVVELTFDPLTGGLGTPVTITMTPAISPLAFDENTTAQWQGIFQPLVGEPSDPFAVTYSAAQFRESSASMASVIVGDGSGPPTLPPEGTPPGSLIGEFTVTVDDISLIKPFTFLVTNPAVDWFRLDYPQDEIGYLDDPPTLESTPLTEIPLYEVPAGGAVPEFLNVAYFYHAACVFLLDENSITIADAPPTFAVDLVTFDSDGAEFDRVSGVVLTLDSDDEDPNHLTYQSDLLKPVVFVEGTIDPALFSDLTVIRAVENGTAIAIETMP